MRIYESGTFNSVYAKLLSEFFLGTPRQPLQVRGRKVVEMDGPVSWTLTSPSNCWLTLPGRKLNPFFAAAELFWILSGRNDVASLKPFNKSIGQFSDNGETFNAAYGERIFRYEEREHDLHFGGLNQFEAALNRLVQDPYSRRAIICLWSPFEDNEAYTKDAACNNILHFQLRPDFGHNGSGDLRTIIYQRSNDLIWGMPYNVVQFTHIAGVFARHLENRLGTGVRITHSSHTVVVGNLHYYCDLYPKTLDETVGAFRRWEIESFSKFPHPVDFSADLSFIRHLAERLFSGEEIDGTEGEYNSYWFQLAAMASRYARRTREETLAWTESTQLLPVLKWLVRDFYADRKEE